MQKHSLVTRVSVVCLAIGLMCIAAGVSAQSGWSTSFKDDFESGDTGKWMPTDGWQVTKDGSFVARGDGSVHRLWPVADLWRNYSVSFRFKLVEGAFEFVFRNREMPPLKMTDEYVVRCAADGFEFFKHKGHEDTEHIPMGSVSFALTLNSWHSARVVSKDNYVDFYVDGQPTYSFRDTEDPLFAGQFTFRLVENTIVHIDDVEVKSE